LKADFSFMATPGRNRPLASTSCCEVGEPERFGDPFLGGDLDASCGLDVLQSSFEQTRRADFRFHRGLHASHHLECHAHRRAAPGPEMLRLEGPLKLLGCRFNTSQLH
jgi:hypothetical protein